MFQCKIFLDSSFFIHSPKHGNRLTRILMPECFTVWISWHFDRPNQMNTNCTQISSHKCSSSVYHLKCTFWRKKRNFYRSFCDSYQPSFNGLRLSVSWQHWHASSIQHPSIHLFLLVAWISWNSSWIEILFDFNLAHFYWANTFGLCCMTLAVSFLFPDIIPHNNWSPILDCKVLPCERVEQERVSNRK